MHLHPLRRGIVLSLIVVIAAAHPLNVIAQEPAVSPEIMMLVQVHQSPVYVVQPPQVAVTSAEVISVVVTPTPTPVPTETPTPAPLVGISMSLPAGSHTDWFAAAGISSSVWSCADALIIKESGYRIDATNSSSGAYGIPQSLPGNKMASEGADWRTNPMTQLRWMAQYVAARYGGFCEALTFHWSHNWY